MLLLLLLFGLYVDMEVIFGFLNLEFVFLFLFLCFEFWNIVGYFGILFIFCFCIMLLF